MIAVEKLTAHPGNVREDLDLTPEFCASIATNGVRVPLLITTGGDGGFRVIEGHRRLAAAVKAGLAEVPYDLDGERAGDEAGQFLDMVTANGAAYRKNFTPLEEATALFAAHEAGATRTRIRRATGRKPDQIKTALAAGSLWMGTREQVGGLDLDEQLTLDELATVAEFEDDPEAVAELMRAISYHYPLEHAAQRIRQDRAEAADHQRIRAELEVAGCPVTDQITPGSSLLSSLAHDGDDLTEDNHRDCPGHAAFFRSHDRRTPVHPRVLLHRPGRPRPRLPLGPAHAPHAGCRSRGRRPGRVGRHARIRQRGRLSGRPAYPGAGARSGSRAGAASDRRGQQGLGGGGRGAQAVGAAAAVWRRTAPKEVIRFVARQLFDLPDALRRGLPAAPGRVVFLELTGKPLEAVLRDCDTSPAARIPLLALAPLAIAYEGEMAGMGSGGTPGAPTPGRRAPAKMPPDGCSSWPVSDMSCRRSSKPSPMASPTPATTSRATRTLPARAHPASRASIPATLPPDHPHPPAGPPAACRRPSRVPDSLGEPRHLAPVRRCPSSALCASGD